MLKEILKEQRKYLDERMKTSKVIERERKFDRHTKLVKVISGVRRCGKSFYTYLILKNQNFGYANFDDERLLNSEPEEVIKAIFEIYGKINIIFFDEIQNLPNWEIFVNRLHREGFDVYLTGSNARLLSSELATHLTGRHVKLELFPFSFREYLKTINLESAESERDLSLLKRELEEYIKTGGFPEILVEKENPYVYLTELFNQIIERDIIVRKRIRYYRTFKELAHTLLSTISGEISVHRMKNFFRIGSEHTVKNYFEYLKESYLFFFLDRFSFKPREVEGFPKKVYSIDTGFAYQLSLRFSENTGRLMENLVAVELMRRRSYFKPEMEVFYFRDSQGHEVDFVIKEGLKIKELIQVTYANSFDEVDHREIRALLKAGELLGCKELKVITWDYEDEKEISWFGRKGKIKFVPMWRWLVSGL